MDRCDIPPENEAKADPAANSIPFRRELGRARPQATGDPEPLDHWVAYYQATDEELTAIAYRWAEGDSGAEGKCDRCPVCTAHNDGCIVLVGLHVNREDTKSFSINSLDSPLDWRGIG